MDENEEFNNLKLNFNSLLDKVLNSREEYIKSLYNLRGISDLYEDSTATQIRRRDPLVLDLDGDGIEIDPLGSGANFDLDRNGFAEETAWRYYES